MSKEKQNEELIQMYRDLAEIFDEEYEKRRLITPQYVAEKMTAKGYRKQSEGEWKLCFEDWRQQIEGDECSVCGFRHYGTSIKHYHYCPNCGAKMKGGAE